VFRVEDLRDSTAHAEIVCIREASSKLKTWRLAVLFHTQELSVFLFSPVKALKIILCSPIKSFPFLYYISLIIYSGEKSSKTRYLGIGHR
jgi:hypothetical protein